MNFDSSGYGDNLDNFQTHWFWDILLPTMLACLLLAA